MTYLRYECPESYAHEHVQVVVDATNNGLRSAVRSQITVPCPDCGRSMVVRTR